MPEYLAPGVYVEETSFRTKSIEGVSTSTAGFIGPCAFGPGAGEPELLTSYADYQRIYGGLDPLDYEGTITTNYMAHAVRAFFEEGGKRLYVVRVAKGGAHASNTITQGDVSLDVKARYPGSIANGTSVSFTFKLGQNVLGSIKSDPADQNSSDVSILRGVREHDLVLLSADSALAAKLAAAKAAAETAEDGLEAATAALTAATDAIAPAEAAVTNAQNVVDALADDAAEEDVNAANAALVVAQDAKSEADCTLFNAKKAKSEAEQSKTEADTLVEDLEAGAVDVDPTVYALEAYFDQENQMDSYKLVSPDDEETVKVKDLAPGQTVVQVLTVNVNMSGMGRFGHPQGFEGLSIHPDHSNSLTSVFATAADGATRATQMFVPLVMSSEEGDGAAIANALLAQTNPILKGDNKTVMDALSDDDSSDAMRTFTVSLGSGSDGSLPGTAEYEGSEGASKTGFKVLEDLEDISIVAAPGSSAGYETDERKAASDAIIRMTVSHCERMRYRVAVLDSGDGQLPSQVRAMRATMDSTHAALYYPWVTIQDPVTRKPLNLPPSGFVAGIYARNDVENGVHKAPANEVVRLATGFETILNKGQQDVLNPEGINCFRFFEGRGYRLWGARTISSDSEWKYVNVRRYFAYLERSIEKGTQWVVFENNHDPLWGRVRRTIEDFLFNEWKNARVMGRKPDDAYFVRCDRSTMTQNDIDNGRLVCEIGVSPVKPAEFVIFRIGQWTADSQS